MSIQKFEVSNEAALETALTDFLTAHPRIISVSFSFAYKAQGSGITAILFYRE